MREKAGQTESLDRQSIVEHIATLPRFNAEQELTLYDFGSWGRRFEPFGCKASPRADLQAIKQSQNRTSKTAVIGLLSGFSILLAYLTAHVRTTANIFACPRNRHAQNPLGMSAATINDPQNSKNPAARIEQG